MGMRDGRRAVANSSKKKSKNMLGSSLLNLDCFSPPRHVGRTMPRRNGEHDPFGPVGEQQGQRRCHMVR